MPVLYADSAARSDMLGDRGPISTYADKILMAYALGFIDKETRKRINIIREIRNACAHSRMPITLEVDALIAPMKVAIGE